GIRDKLVTGVQTCALPILAARLARDPIAAAYCSPMQRTVETASIVAQPHGLELIRRDGLREIDHGRWEGLRRADVEALYPDEYRSEEHTSELQSLAYLVCR